MVEFTSMLEASFFSTSRIIFICICGFILVKSKIINKQIMKGIAEMTANFLIPCLSISEICKSFHIKNYEMWLPILIYCLFNVGIGYFIGEIICYFNKPKSEIRRLILIVCMFSNSTSMQLVYVDSLGAILGKMINTTETEAKSRGYVIVLIYTIFVNFLRWSIGYNLMKPDSKKSFYKSNLNELNESYLKDNEINQVSINYKSLSHDTLNNVTNFKEEDLKILGDSNLDSKLNDTGNIEEKSVDNIKTDNYSTCLKVIKEGINMPFVTGVTAIILSSLPYINTFFSEPNQLGYKLLIESCEAVGKCVSTFVILILGLNLSLTLTEKNEEEGNKSDRLENKIILSILVTKAFIFPIIGLFAIWIVGYQTKILTDPLLCFLLLTNFCTPTAINMITIAIINKFQINNLSRLLIYQYLMGCITVTMWTAIYMNLFL